MKGIIESYSVQKKFGFIKADNSTRAYFYRESIEANGYIPARVGFEIVNTSGAQRPRK